jgi:hypothetical protein
VGEPRKTPLMRQSYIKRLACKGFEPRNFFRFEKGFVMEISPAIHKKKVIVPAAAKNTRPFSRDKNAPAFGTRRDPTARRRILSCTTN